MIEGITEMPVHSNGMLQDGISEEAKLRKKNTTLDLTQHSGARMILLVLYRM